MKHTLVGNWNSSIRKAKSKGETFFRSIPVIINIKMTLFWRESGVAMPEKLMRHAKWVGWKEVYIPLFFGRNLACKSSCLYSSVSRCSFRSRSQNLTNELLALALQHILLKKKNNKRSIRGLSTIMYVQLFKSTICLRNWIFPSNWLPKDYKPVTCNTVNENPRL